MYKHLINKIGDKITPKEMWVQNENQLWRSSRKGQ